MSPEVESDASKGWTLQQALELTADPNLWDAFSAAQKEWEKIKNSVAKVWITERHPAEILATKVLHAASVEVRRHLHNLLVSGALTSIGSRGEGSVPPSPIYCEGWQRMSVRNYATSIAQDLTGSKSKIYNIRVFPLIHSHDAAAQLSGRSLVEAFQRCVLQDPELIAAGKRVPDRDRYESLFSAGQFPRLVVDYKWPLDWTAEQLAIQFVSSFFFMGDSPTPPPPIRRLARVITDRLARLRQRLSNGELVARATFARTGTVQHIESHQWARPDLWIDVRGGDLLETEEHKPVPRWTGLSLLQPGQIPVGRVQAGPPQPEMFPVKPRIFDEVRPSPIEPQRRSTKKSIVTAESRMASRKECAVWLEEMMRASPDKRALSKAMAWKKAQQKWRGKLSERAFDGAWAEAIQRAPAPAWSAPGAPKKRQKKP